MTETELFLALKRQFPNQGDFQQVVSRFIHHPSVWKGLQDDDFFGFAVKELSNSVDKWCLTGICRVATEFFYSASLLERNVFIQANTRSEDWFPSFFREVTPNLPFFEFYPNLAPIDTLIDRHSWQGLFNRLPEISSDAVSTVWGTIFSLALEKSEDKASFFGTFLSDQNVREDIDGIMAFILAANPDIYLYFEEIITNCQKTIEPDRLIRLLPKIRMYGGLGVAEITAQLILKYFPFEHIVSLPDDGKSVEDIIERLYRLKTYGTLTRYLSSEKDTGILLEQIDICIEKLRSHIINLIQPNPAGTIYLNSSPDKFVSQTTISKPQENSLTKRLPIIKEIAETDRDAGYLLAREVVAEINSPSNMSLQQVLGRPDSFIDINDLVNFLCEFGMADEASRIIDTIIRENSFDPNLLRIAGRLEHEYGGHDRAIQYYARLDTLTDLSREEKIYFSKSLEYCERWDDAFSRRAGINLTSLDDLLDLVKCAYSVEKPEIIEDIRNIDIKGFFGSDFHKALVAWKEIVDGNRVKGETGFNELISKPVCDPNTIIILADFLLRQNQRERAIGVLGEFIQKIPIASVLLKKMIFQIGLEHSAEMTADLEKLANLSVQMNQKEYETYLSILIELGEYEIASTVIERNPDNWPLSTQLSEYKARIFLEKSAFHRAEKILKKTVHSADTKIEGHVDLSLAILKCSRSNFPFGISTERISEVCQLLAANAVRESNDFFFHLLKAEIDDDPVAAYKKLLSKDLAFNLNEKWHLYTALGRQFFLRSKYDQAIVHFLEALAIKKDHTETILFISESFARLQLWDEAINLVDNFVINEKKPLIFYWRLHQKLNAGDTWHQYISRLHSENPDNSTIRFLYLAAIISRGNLEEGLRMIDEMIIAKPDDVTRKLIFAQILADAGETARSKRIIELILADDNVLTYQDHLSCAFLLDHLGDFEKEMNLLDQFPMKNDLILAYTAHLKSINGQFGDALQAVKKSLDYQENQFDRSEQDSIVVKIPEIWKTIVLNPAIIFLIGSDAANQTGDRKSALDLIEQGLDQFAENLDLLKRMLELSMLFENKDGIEKWAPILSSRLEDTPDGIGFCILGELALLNGEEVHAARYLSKAIELDQGENARIQAMQARMLVRNGNMNEARIIFEYIKNEVLFQKTRSANAKEKDREFNHVSGLWFLKAAFELGESRFCLDLCQQEIAQTQNNLQYQMIFMTSLARSLVRNDVVKEFHVKNHFDHIGDQDLRFYEEMKENSQKEKINNKDLLDRILICDAIISGELSEYKNILKSDLDQDFASIKIKAEYLINGSEAAEILHKTLNKDPLSSLQLAGLINETNPLKAITIIKSLLDDNPDNPLKLAALGITLRKTGQLDDAYAAISLALHFWPDEYEWEILAAEINLEIGDVKTALEHYEKSNRICPNESAKEFMQRILVTNRNPRAIGLLEEKAIIFPHDTMNLLDLANLYLDNKQFSKAVSALERILQNDNEDIQALVMLAVVSIKLQNYEKAGDFLENALKIDPDCVDALMLKANVIQRMYGYQQAMDFLDGLISKNKENNVLILDKKASMIESELGQKAALEYLESLEDDGKNERILLKISRLFFEINELDAAENTVNQVLQSGSNTRAYALLAEIAAEKGDLDRAVDAYIKTIKSEPLEKNNYIRLAEIYEKQRNLQMAKETMQNALKTIPEDFDLLFKFAHISFKNRQSEEGIDYLKRALLIKPNHLDANDLLNKFQVEAGV